jgi:hypothetical protein
MRIYPREEKRVNTYTPEAKIMAPTITRYQVRY